MPNQLKRYQGSGDLHFLTFSCKDRQPYLADDKTKDIFEQSLEQTRRRYILRVYGYVVMPEHAHLLLSEPARSSLDLAIQALKTSISKQSAQRPFWLPRYYDFNVFTEEKRIEKLRYMHRNPVTRGLVDQPERWRWSSFPHYVTGIAGVVEIESNWTAGKRQGVQILSTAPASK
jgi:putative transposase